VYIKQNKLIEALEYFSRALSIKERVKGKESIDCVIPLYKVGVVYKKMGLL